MLFLAWRNLTRRPIRTGLTLASLALAVAVLAALSAFGEGYQRAVRSELDGMGVQLMLVPLGCPYDAAARVLKGRSLEFSLPEAALEQVRRDPAVAVAAPLLTAAIPRPKEGRTDLWAGIDSEALKLRTWWKARSGSAWFSRPDGAILGSEAASVELRSPGDALYSPETGQSFRVEGVLERSGTSDDSLFFIPLKRAQAMFHQPGRLTAIAIRLKDPELSGEASERLQRIQGAQVVTLTEMMGTFLNLVGMVRALMLAVALIAVTASALGVFNTVLGNVVEQSAELSLMRALGASRGQIFTLVVTQALQLGALGTVLGLGLAALAGGLIQNLVRGCVPLAPQSDFFSLTPTVAAGCLLIGVGVGLVAGLAPAWRASQAPPAAAMRAA